jgi:hypothetical protein
MMIRKKRTLSGSSDIVCLLPALVLLLAATHLFGCLQPDDYTVTISHYDPDQAFDGTTCFQTYVICPGYFCVNMEGGILWHRNADWGILGDSAGLEVARDGSILALPGSRPTILSPVSDSVLWEWDDTRNAAHHSITMTPRGTILFLERETGIPVEHEPWAGCEITGDVIKEVDLGTHEVVWEWHLHHYVDPVEHHFEGMCTGRGLDPSYFGDWSHCNSVKFYADTLVDGSLHDVVLLNARYLDTFWMIDYETSEILWSFGRHGTIGDGRPPEDPLFSHAHEVEMLEDGHFILFDNGNHRVPRNSRALEIRVNSQQSLLEAVWSWNEIMNSPAMGDADRLPNGNTLVTDVFRGRIIEVNPEGEKVWQMDLTSPLGPPWIYKFERIPPWAPCPDADDDGYGDPANLDSL